MICLKLSVETQIPPCYIITIGAFSVLNLGGLNNLHVCTVYIFQKEIFVGATIDFGGFNPPNCAYDNNFMLCQCNWVAFQYNNLFGKFNAFNLRRRRNIIISRVTTYLTLLLYYITMYYYGCMYI